jgi:hypothetical protein
MDIEQIEEKSTAVDVFTVIAIFLIIGIPIYGYFKLKPDRIFDENQEIQEETETPDDQEVISEDVDEVEDEPVEITGYTDELVEIDGQWAYIIVPDPIDVNNLPTLIIYNHGSITEVKQNLDEEFRSKLLQYGQTLTPNNYIFAVSNAHGVNWGSLDSINDNFKMYEYIKDKYGIQEKIYMIGFSMGGLPTMNFATTYPDLVSKIALLAPTTRSSEWDQERVDKLEGMDIKIWHGTADVNVGFVYTQNFVNKLENFGKSVDFVVLQEKGHWDVDTEYVDDILQFFNQSETVSE